MLSEGIFMFLQSKPFHFKMLLLFKINLLITADYYILLLEFIQMYE